MQEQEPGRVWIGKYVERLIGGDKVCECVGNMSKV